MAAPTASTAIRPSPALEAVPPVTPNLVRRKEIPGARQVGRNTLETLLFRGLSTPVALLLVVIQSRFLDPAGRGSFVLVVLSVAILARLFGQFGVAVTSRSPGRDVRPLVVCALALSFLLGLAGIALILLGGALVHAIGIRLAAIAAPALIPNVVSACISGVLLGQARIRLWNYIQVLPPVLTLVGMLVVVVGLGHGVQGAVGVWTAAYFATAAFAVIAARDLWLPPVMPRILGHDGRALAWLAFVMGAVQIVNLISYRVELLVLDHYKGLAVHESPDRAARVIRNACTRGLLYTIGIAVAVGAVAPFAIPLLFGNEFRGATRPLALLLPGVVVYAPVSILVVYLSVRRERPRLSLLVSVVGLVVTAGASFVFVPRYGASGAALASAIGYLAGGLAAWLCFVGLAGLTPLGRRRPH